MTYPQPPRWLVTLLLSALALLGTLLLEAFGDSVFDNLTESLGKRRTLQLLFLLSCTTVCLAYWVFYRPLPRKLERRRAVYWARSDTTPFCAFRYETASKQHHLVGPIEMFDKSVERWECRVCHHDYTATKKGDELLMRSSYSPGKFEVV